MANGIYTNQISGGDIHFFRMAQAAMDAGYTVHFFGGHALEKQLQQLYQHFELTLTDSSMAKPLNANSPTGQVRLLLDYGRRFIGSLRQLWKIGPTDIAYAASDYWFDVWPVILCRTKTKWMIWHMEAPSFRQILHKSRADVDASRAAPFYYWLSQNLSIVLFRLCRNKHMFYVHPDMEQKLLRLGYWRGEISYISFGVDTELADRVPPQQKTYDALWIGRVHRQKGIDDLLATLVYLKERIENFRAILVGNLRKDLEPEIKKRNLSQCVEFSGFVSEEEKFRLFHASRVFLMTSKFEGSPRVVAEALVCRVPVVAYDVETYRPIFKDFLRYIPKFDLPAYQKEAEAQIKAMRAGKNYLSQLNVAEFAKTHAWDETGRSFLSAV